MATPAFAAVGEQVDKSMSQTITPEVPATAPATLPEAGHTFVKYMRFYVPAQAASGEPADTDGDTGSGTGVTYYNYEGDTLIEDRPDAKPSVSAFIYGPVEELDTSADTEANAGGFSGHGYRDAYGAVSLDDGFTWKQTNLSESADTSVVVQGMTAPYPSGDVNNVVHAIAGNKIVVAWQSRSCDGGSPGYTLSDADGVLTPDGEAVATYLGVTTGTDLYLDDVFGVAGSQGFHDYAEDGYPSVGEVPYNCLWTARGVLFEGDDPRTDGVEETNHVVWYKAERLTSGRRDVNRIEIQAVAGAGVALTWQEDPDGLRPGSGEGPGEGWSGATAASQTDIWYSFLPWENFEAVLNDADASTPYETLADYWPDNTTKPKPYVPFAVPMRLTNNARCDVDGADSDLYCTATAVDYGLKNQCATTVTTHGAPDGIGGGDDYCVSEDGLPNLANTAATRARMSLQPRDTDGDGVTDSAWVVVLTEEDKGLGKFGFTYGTETYCGDPDIDREDDCVEADIGKNIWYHSFDMGKPVTSADTSSTGLLANLGGQGNMINQPEVNWTTGQMMEPLNTSLMWGFGDYDYDLYRTEIARRGSLVVQPLSNVASSQLTALLMYKQGQLNQGGPADIMARRVVNNPDSDDPAYNPYDFSNLVCADVAYGDGSNPYYPKGVCLSPSINLSAVTLENCTNLLDDDTGATGDPVACPETTDVADGYAILDSDPEDQTTFDKVTTWYQCPGSDLCGDGDSNLADLSWYNPLDVAKGHRGYIWGNMVVAMYAWSPNWKLNAKGHDHYGLYIRRSFDGGQTWTTTPLTWGGQGSYTCEWMRDGVENTSESTQRCVAYAAGADEQARNVSQLSSNQVDQDGNPIPGATNRYTVLDPRYAPDPPTMPDILADTDADGVGDTLLYPEADEFNPSRFYVVFEIGDNTTVTEGEAEPLDMSYGRAVNFGDYYQAVQLTTGGAPTVESNLNEVDLLNCGTTEFCNYFARLNSGTTTGSEASLAMAPSGEHLYAVWSSHNESTGVSDAQYARVWYDDDVLGTAISWTVPDDALPGDYPATDDPTIGDGGTGGGGGGGGGGDDDGDEETSGGCSIASGNAAFDPLLPAVVLLALGYLGLRRRSAKASH